MASRREAWPKRFGSTWALQDCTVCGPAGSDLGPCRPQRGWQDDASTSLVGLREPSAGQALVLGRQPRQSEEFLASVGYLAQEAPLLQAAHGRWHLDLGAYLNLRWDKVVATDRLRALQIPLEPVGTLSGGQRSQVALGLAWPNALMSCSWTSPLPRSTRGPTGVLVLVG